MADEPEPKATTPMRRRHYDEWDEPKAEEGVVQHDKPSDFPLDLGDEALAEKKRFLKQGRPLGMGLGVCIDAHCFSMVGWLAFSDRNFGHGVRDS